MADTQTYNRAARYLGQILRRRVSGKWSQCLDPRNGFYGRGVIEVQGAPISPHALVSAAMDRRTGQFLRTCVAALVPEETA